MALNGNTIGAQVASLMKAAGSPPISDAKLTQLWKDVMNAIYNDVKSTAQVSATVIVTSVTGVTTGPGVSGPGTGTATGTIS